MNDAAAKIKMINASLRCFTFGMLSLIPFLGIPFGAVALVYAGKARIAEKHLWNPARTQMMVGGIVASLCVILWTFLLILIIWNIGHPNPDY